MAKISVVVPVYNVEPYLRKCLDSILSQTIQLDEIILVNDGSTDGSGRICDEYERKHENITVIHKPNGGLSSARNAGIEVAKGELIAFIDSDDWIEPDYFELLYEGIKGHDADISVVQFSKETNFDKIEYVSDTSHDWQVADRYEAMELLFSEKIIGFSACNKLYRARLFEGIRYPEGRLMEDKATTYKLIHRSGKIAINRSKKYHYYLRENSIIRGDFNKKNFDSLDIHEDIISFIDNHYPQLSTVVRGRYVYEAVRILFMMVRSRYIDKKDYKRCTAIVSKNIRHFYSVRNFDMRIKALVAIVFLFPWLPIRLAGIPFISKYARKIKLG